MASQNGGVSIDSSASAQFREQLTRYYDDSVLDPSAKFVCRHGAACERSINDQWYFAAGQLSYVGDAYATKIDGAPYRILMIPMQVGQGQHGITMTIRAQQVLDRIGQRSCLARIREGFELGVGRQSDGPVVDRNANLVSVGKVAGDGVQFGFDELQIDPLLQNGF